MSSMKTDQGHSGGQNVLQKLKNSYEKCFHFSVFLTLSSVLLLLFSQSATLAAEKSAEFLLVSSLVTGVVSCVLTQMVAFYFYGVNDANGFSAFVGCIPFIMVDICSVEFLAGLCCLFVSRSPSWFVRALAGYTGSFLAICVFIAGWMFYRLRFQVIG
jgi:hypothetical protein